MELNPMQNNAHKPKQQELDTSRVNLRPRASLHSRHEATSNRLLRKWLFRSAVVLKEKNPASKTFIDKNGVERYLANWQVKTQQKHADASFPSVSKVGSGAIPCTSTEHASQEPCASAADASDSKQWFEVRGCVPLFVDKENRKHVVFMEDYRRVWNALAIVTKDSDLFGQHALLFQASVLFFFDKRFVTAILGLLAYLIALFVAVIALSSYEDGVKQVPQIAFLLILMVCAIATTRLYKVSCNDSLLTVHTSNELAMRRNYRLKYSKAAVERSRKVFRYADKLSMFSLCKLYFSTVWSEMMILTGFSRDYMKESSVAGGGTAMGEVGSVAGSAATSEGWVDGGEGGDGGYVFDEGEGAVVPSESGVEEADQRPSGFSTRESYFAESTEELNQAWRLLEEGRGDGTVTGLCSAPASGGNAAGPIRRSEEESRLYAILNGLSNEPVHVAFYMLLNVGVKYLKQHQYHSLAIDNTVRHILLVFYVVLPVIFTYNFATFLFNYSCLFPGHVNGSTIPAIESCTAQYIFYIGSVATVFMYVAYCIVFVMLLLGVAGMYYGAVIVHELALCWVDRYAPLRKCGVGRGRRRPDSGGQSESDDSSSDENVSDTERDDSDDDVAAEDGKLTSSEDTIVLDSSCSPPLTTRYRPLTRRVTRDAYEHYLFIKQYVDKASAIWSPILLVLFIISVGIIAYTLYFAATNSESEIVVAGFVLVSVIFQFLSLFPIYCIAYANAAMGKIRRIFRHSSSPRDFRIIGGRRAWIEYLEASPAFWTVFGMPITFRFLYSILGSLFSGLMVSLIAAIRG